MKAHRFLYCWTIKLVLGERIKINKNKIKKQEGARELREPGSDAGTHTAAHNCNSSSREDTACSTHAHMQALRHVH